MDDFARRFLDALGASRNRRVRALAEVATETLHGMRIDGISPSGHAYYLTTESGKEITVGLGRHWHAHFGEVAHGFEDREPFAHVVAFLEDLVTDRFVITEWFRGPTYLGASGHRAGLSPTPRPGSDRVVPLSWTGTNRGGSRGQ